MKRIRWAEVRQKVIELIRSSPSYRFPTVRSVYYYLGSLGIIPLTEYGYKKLDALTVEMRKNNEIPWGYFTVKRGESGYLGAKYISPENYLDFHIKRLKECWENYEIPIWYQQPVHVEVWIEKKGLLPTIEHWLRELDVKVRSGEGYAAWEFVWQSCEDIKSYLEDRTGDEVWIYYLGDLDPSGIDITRHVKEAVEFFKINLKFERLALNPEQVKKYNLPLWPERMEVIEKLEKDPRRKWYFQKYGRIACELDAFVALAPEHLQQIVVEAVKRHLNPEIKEGRDELNEKAKQKLKEKLEKMKIQFEDENRSA